MTMKHFSSFRLVTLSVVSALIPLSACTADITSDSGTGGTASGGLPTSGGATTGGALPTGGIGTGGLATGGAATGGVATGGAGTGGLATGGAATGGESPSGGGNGTGGGYPATYATVTNLVGLGLNGMYIACGNSSCHNGETQPRMFWESSADDALLYQTLTTFAADLCDNKVLVVPNDPENSALLSILRGECDDFVSPPSPPMSSRMPSGCDPDPVTGNCLDEATIGSIEQWIASGAAM
jgi:hypothetical protein